MTSWPAIARRIRVPLGFAFAVFYLYFAQPKIAALAAGAAIVAVGLVLRGLASGHVRKNEALTTTGPYAYTRNPLYLGSLIIACGFALAARSWWIAGALVIFFAVVYVPVIRSEEDFLSGRFPEFESYAREVPPLLPRLTPRPGSHGAFSGQLYWQHREYNALLGALAILAALVFKLWRA